jgi:TonB-linked SusC/RagA family outer membrane protein
MLSAAELRKYKKEYPNIVKLKDYGYSTDWLDVIMRPLPVSQDHNLSFSGGTAQTNYTASLNYKKTEGIFLHSDNERLVGHINIRHSMFNNKVQANLNIIGRSQDYWTGGDGFSWNGVAYRNALTRNPTDRPKDDNGNYIYRYGFEEQNPLVLLNERHGKNRERRLRLNGTITVNPIKSLSLELLGSTNQWTQLRGFAETLQDVSAVKGGQRAYASRGAGNYKSNQLRLTGHYKKSIAGNNIKFLGGYSYQQVVNAGFYMQNWNFPTDKYGYNRMQNGNALAAGKAVENSNKSGYKLISFFSRLNYNYKNKYLLMGSVRYEGNSKFGANNKWGVFPAVSGGWRISSEKFMQGVDFLSDLKLRAGFGVTGISPNVTYASLESLNYGARIYNNGKWVQGLSPARNANPNLRWEKKNEIDVGLDFSMFNSSLSGSFDIYRRKTTNLLYNYSVPVPPYVYGTILANVGAIKNDGIEVALNYQLNKGDFSWQTSVNYSTNRNKLLRLSNDQFQLTNDFIYTGYTGAPIQLTTSIVKVGQPIGDFYGYKSVGITDNGKWIVLDKNGNRARLDSVRLPSRHVLGNGVPNWHLAFNNTFKYKNFDLKIDMHGAFAFQILNFQRMFYQNPLLTPMNMLVSAFKKVHGKALINEPQSYVSYFVENGAYWKVDNVTLGYTFNVGAFNNYVKKAQIYVSGKNLVTITGYKGMDPEVNSTGLAPGIDSRDKFPTTRTFTFGVNLKF